MKFIEKREEKVLLEVDVLEAATLLDVLVEVMEQWNSLDNVALSSTYDEVSELRRSMSAIVEKMIAT